MDYPAFAYPSRFAEISGLPVKEVRKLCSQQIIPNERTRRGFRIDVEAALTVLQERAATFAGHKKQRQPVYVQTPRKARRAQMDFLARLEALKKGC